MNKTLIFGLSVSLLAVTAGAPAMAQDAAMDAKAAKAAQKAAEKRQRDLVRLYGLGPYPEETETFVSDKPEKLRPLYKTLYEGGERNAVLNLQRLGLAAMSEGEWDSAKWAFDKALTRIEAIYANNPRAEAARSSFHNESNKDFKGEPYERSMAYYYRGLLYMRDGDYDNARASFKGAEYQDTLSDAETFQSDFALMNYLIGWTQHCQGQGSSAEESFKIATSTQTGLKAPGPKDNTLFLAEIGTSPVKGRGGQSEQMLTFAAGPAYPENTARFTFSGADAPAQPVDTMLASSISYQATTRGGRAIDGLMQGKATLKEASSGIGSGLLSYGASQGDTTTMAVGAVLSLFSSAVKTKADIRQWDNLPDAVLIGTAETRSPNWTSQVTFMNNDQALDVEPGGWMRADQKGCSVVWTRSRKADMITDGIVGEDDGVARAVKKKKDVQQKDAAFRQWLEL